jgi:hypothetical protein
MKSNHKQEPEPTGAVQGIKTFKPFKRLLILTLLMLIGGCRQQMADQPHQRPLQPSNFFDDGMASRPVEAGTVARTGKEQNDDLLRGRIDGKFADTFPFQVTMEVLARGQERYEIFCSPCHDRLGTGQGMIVRRGFTPARSFHEDRLRNAPVGHYFEVMSQGFGPMPSYAGQLSPQDRWAVIAYIRALQLGRNARLDELTPEDRARLSKEAK